MKEKYTFFWCIEQKLKRKKRKEKKEANKSKLLFNYQEKLYFTTLNYALDYTLHPILSKCTLYTMNYHIYHTLHPGVIFAVIFNRILLHVTSIWFLLRWNKVKRLKHPSSKSIRTKPILFLRFSFKIFKFTSLIPWQNSFTIPHHLP